MSSFSSLLLCEKLSQHHLLINVSSCENIEIQSVTNDSRKVKENGLFTAIEGQKSDGHLFISNAIEKGATVVICTNNEVEIPKHILKICVTDSYYAHAIACELLYDNPMKKLKIAAVTGTNGKTTTAFLLKHILHILTNEKIGLLSTVCTDTGLGHIPSERTTPDAEEIQFLFAEMVENRCPYAVMEYSSHGLFQHRTGTEKLTTGVFTNLTGDHLDYHENMPAYYAAKKNLFTDYLNLNSIAIINIDDPYGIRLTEELKCKIITFGQNDQATWIIQRIHTSLSGTRFELKTPDQTYALTTPHIGEHNVYNLVSAIGGAYGLGFDLESIVEATHKAPLPPISGRLESILLRNGVNIFIDYAHTDDALEHALRSLNALTLCKNRVITVFGCGGNRDKTKRPRMGHVASSLSDVVWLTSDNPRDENPEEIINQIAEGIPAQSECRIVRKTDRKMAIRLALMDAREGDVILVAGKGHETYQEIKGIKTPFDDKKIVIEIATLLGLY